MYVDMNREYLKDINTTEDVRIPEDPLERVIGHDDVMPMIKIAAKQRRHLLLVGPPGIGKSLLAQALSFHLPEPSEEITVVHNPERPERPFVEVKSRKEIENEILEIERAEGELIDPQSVPDAVAERLGFKCIHCGEYSSAYSSLCPKCGGDKFSHIKARRKHIGDLLGMFEMSSGHLSVPQKRVTTTRIIDGVEEVVIYERVGGDEIKVLDQSALEKRRQMVEEKPRNVIVPLDRKTFVQATGASETELLGDVRHDPYGGHPDLGSQPYERVVPGAVHEAHEGVLFIDEIVHIAGLQRFIFSAMQDKTFPIVGRNPQSAGSSVKVDEVPCDFIFVGACNIADLQYILPPLRSRVQGEGYELLLNTTMPDTDENRAKIVQFVAQEIELDGRIPHARAAAVEILIEEARRRARVIDDTNDALTLRLRDLGGVVRMAGDLAVMDGSKYIESKHMEVAVRKAVSVEDQIIRRYKSFEKALEKDLSSSQRMSQHRYSNENIDRSYM
ncbi:Lon protease family protein [Methanothermobacter wolfeii]|uniref:Lon protease family protein n=2 Tax=Methanothermobacter wolfeii TaxID=145261 RepID=A0ABU8TUZ4_METWO|nr:Lon protease family protein [Methanothermobacter wolfeii]NLM02541.1 Lon protease family protein [Methanothermobacter wolfeii]SCM57799.1 putative lon protease homolog [Methanothermobacter wolfeii]